MRITESKIENKLFHKHRRKIVEEHQSDDIKQHQPAGGNEASFELVFSPLLISINTLLNDCIWYLSVQTNFFSCHSDKIEIERERERDENEIFSNFDAVENFH